jgi:hypothetical protein
MPKTAKKPTRSKIVKKLDVIFSQYIRLKYADKRGMVKCFTCDKVGHWKNGGIQNGHFRSRRFYATRWSEDNCRPQCVRCNMFDSGRAYEFGLKLGEELAQKIYLESQQIVKFTTDELIEKINHYSSEVKRMT